MREDDTFANIDALNRLWEETLSDQRHLVSTTIEVAATIQWLIDNDPRLSEEDQRKFQETVVYIMNLPQKLVHTTMSMEYNLNGVEGYRVSGGIK